LKVYGYTLPQLPTHKGYVKVGETTQPDVNKRVLQQTGTIGVQPNLVFERPALRSDNILFHDRDLHRYYRLREIKQVLNENRATEWFDFGDPALAEQMTDDYIRQDYDEVQVSDEKIDYILRAEQDEAVEATLDYWNHPIHGKEFLWNAKPRFGKTLTTYDFARKINAENVLIVTNRPAIANSWYDDFTKFIAWQEPGLKFVSETSALSERSPISRDEYLSYVIADSENKLNIRCLAFISLQDLKGARFAGGDFDKLAWVGDVEWNLLVIDEAHEGVDTIKTDRAFEKINRNFTLHLSGTPFKALATQKFHAQQIFNWSYLDEQQAKEQWEHNQPDTNPYAALPTMSLFTYQMSKMVEEHVARGIDIDEEKNVDYTFDLSEFFSTKDDGTFTYEADVIRFLDNLCAGKFPFAKTEHQQELNHTFWLLPRVASAKAMEKLLRAHPFFKDYEIVLAAGDGISLQDDETFEETEDFVKIEKRNAHSYDRLKKALKEFDKTITLTVSQLTTGVTIPEWTAVFILNNIKSPAMYFQAAFRAQNPYEFQNQETGEWYRKENSYVFDFAPDRTLVLFDEFANNLSDEGLTSTIDERKTNIRELINFFPVIAEDEDGSMTELSPEDVMTFPNRIKAAEVVKRGFMSNLLFVNISAIFAAPAEFKAILDKISPEKNKRLGDKREINLTDPMLNDKGEVEIDPKITINTHHDLFGPPIYRTDIEAVVEKIAEITDREKAARQVAQVVVGQLAEGFENTRAEFGLTRKAATQDAKKAENLLTTRVEESLFRREEKIRQADAAYEAEVQKQPTIHDREAVTEQYEARKQEIEAEFIADVKKSAEEVTLHVVETQLEKQEEVKKKTTEDDVRDHLRGFARTIPAFLMAYGSPETTLANYDKNIDPDTFLELTSITLGEFRMLRDGFEDTDANGITRTFKGLFNEGVFNASVAEFFRIKEKLADYLHTEEEEDIFDYIPPQRTNQIFTPKRVVKMMVDTLEEHDPQNFRNKETTFIDLYAKS
ncbi:MAG: DEAD/DEAH box helicase family protein, partial [Smithella sp.]|nr:DEAD/DEAH box helicase family protein [Smithella sp.]